MNLLTAWRKWRSEYCSACYPPDGSYGRDTHHCMLEKKHRDYHECKCGATWP